MIASSEPVRGRQYGCVICLGGFGVLQFLVLCRTTSGNEEQGAKGCLPFNFLWLWKPFILEAWFLFSDLVNFSLDLNECDLVMRHFNDWLDFPAALS